MSRIHALLKVLMVACVCCVATTTVAAQADSVRILFVGNSFTYFYNLPQMVAAMGQDQGVPLYTRQSTVGGSNLEQHWKGEKGTTTHALLDGGEWDYVILNNHSTSAIDTPESFMEYGKLFADRIREAGAKPVFMMTWAYDSNPLMLPEINRMYEKLAEESESEYVPCGPLFARTRELRPDLDLFFDDKHPSYTGTYLLALAFYRYLSGRSVSDIPDRLTTTDYSGEKLYLVFMPTEDADFLRQLVDEFPLKK